MLKLILLWLAIVLPVNLVMVIIIVYFFGDYPALTQFLCFIGGMVNGCVTMGKLIDRGY